MARPLRNPIAPGLLISPPAIRRADILHAHNEHSFAAVSAIVLGRRFRKPVLLTVHGRLVMGSRIGDLTVAAYERTVARAVFRGAAGITAATSSEKEWLCRRHPLSRERVDVVPVGVDLTYWDALREAPAERMPWMCSIDGRKVILVATQLVRRKGIEYLIRAMETIRAAEPASLLLIAGSGSEEQALKRLAKSLNLGRWILFLGRVFDAELSALYRAADVFVLPSLSEGLSTCVMEALAHSTSVVATRIDGVKESFGGVVHLVDPGESGALAEGVLEVLRNPRKHAAQAAAGRRLLEREYTWPTVAARMAAAYRSVLEGMGIRRR